MNKSYNNTNDFLCDLQKEIEEFQKKINLAESLLQLEQMSGYTEEITNIYIQAFTFYINHLSMMLESMKVIENKVNEKIVKYNIHPSYRIEVMNRVKSCRAYWKEKGKTKGLYLGRTY